MKLLFAVFLLHSASANGDNLTVSTIIERSVAATNADWKAAPDYDCEMREQDDGGNKTYEQLMVLGSPYRRLVAINEEPLPPAEQRKEDQKLQQVIVRRQRESQSERQRRIVKYEKEREHNHLLMEELTKAFHFELLGEQTLDSRQVYVLSATPLPGFHPPNMETKVLTGMEGMLWIDTKEFQWVKVEAEAIRPVSIEGFLARVEPGTRFELEKAPVDPPVWLPRHFAVWSRARVLWIFNQERQQDDTYFNCHRERNFGAVEVSSNHQKLNR